MDIRHGTAGARALSIAHAARWLAAAHLGIIYAGATLLTPLYRLYREEFRFSQLTLTLIYAAYVVGNLVALLPLGRLSDQLGRRSVNAVAVLVATLATFLYLAATSTAWLVAGRITSGLAIGLAATATTAWLAELTPDKGRASLFATCGNFAGLALGALLAGLLASFLPRPLELSYLAYLLPLGASAAFVAWLPESAPRRVGSARELKLRPRLGVPRRLLGPFLAPACTAFATFAVVGYYGALMPSLLARALHRPSPALGGAMLALLCVLGVLSALLARALSSRVAMLAGLALLLPGLALLPSAEALHSFALLVCGAAITGPATLLGYRGSLQVVNEIAPAERRGEVTGSYILCCYAGNALPIVGIGVLTSFACPFTADLSFAVLIAGLAVLALITGATRLRR